MPERVDLIIAASTDGRSDVPGDVKALQTGVLEREDEERIYFYETDN